MFLTLRKAIRLKLYLPFSRKDYINDSLFYLINFCGKRKENESKIKEDVRLIQFQKQIIKTKKYKTTSLPTIRTVSNLLVLTSKFPSGTQTYNQFELHNLNFRRSPVLNKHQFHMINNYVEYQYQPCHLIYSFNSEKRLSLYLGDVSSALDLEFIHKNNIKTVVTAAASMSQVSYESKDNIKHVIYSVLDHKNQNLIQYFDEFFQLIEREIRNGSILVHCAAGISRSSTLVISYLMKKNNWTFKQSIKYVRKSRPQVLPNLGFERQLKQLEKMIVQQQNRRLKSKTSESNKHHENKFQILPEIGIFGVNSTKDKVLEAFRIYKKQENQQKIHKKNFMFNNHLIKSDKVASLKYQQFQKFKPLSRQFGQTKSVSLQQGIDRNIRNKDESSKVTSYVEVKTENNDISSRKPAISRNGIFDSAIIPIKYNSVSKPVDKLKRTNMKFMQLNNNNITINKIGAVKQKYCKNSPTLSLSKVAIDQIIQGNLNNDFQLNPTEIKGKVNFSIKLAKSKESQIEANSNIPGRKQFGLIKRDIWPARRENQRNHQKVKQDEEGSKKIKIKNLLFYQNDD